MSKQLPRLPWITVGFVYLLMVWGNMVSATGSGLACPDWPTCHGTLFPPLSFEVVLEWGHRLLAFTASMLILTTVVQTVRARSNPALQRAGRSVLGVLLLQIVLGGTTVLLGLSVAVSSVHLIIAHLVWGTMITIACVKTWDDPIVPGSQKIGRLAVAGLFALMVQIAMGGIVRHGHAGLACPNFPGCLDGFFPMPFTFETGFAFIHRWWGVLMLGLFVHLGLTARRGAELAKPCLAVAGLGIVQVLLGIATVLSGLQTHTRATHAAVGYGLWGLLFYIAIRSGRLTFLWRASESRSGGVSGATASVTG